MQHVTCTVACAGGSVCPGAATPRHSALGSFNFVIMRGDAASSLCGRCMASNSPVHARVRTGNTRTRHAVPQSRAAAAVHFSSSWATDPLAVHLQGYSVTRDVCVTRDMHACAPAGIQGCPWNALPSLDPVMRRRWL